ncbi:MAG: outer membrane protein transport protein [Gammaproteobacteria bacterium]|nr:outer membrane protein transport protein [Gammaproteobacteria bacterium]NNM21571.1 hypothetical protein [Gammaproteobacteria bacterium]
MALVSMLLALPAAATNGYFTHGKGTRNKGMAGAGSAQPASAIELANNPASAVLVRSGFEAGAGLFSPRRSYTTSASQAGGNGGAFTIGPNAIDSAREGFVIPHLARTWNHDRHAFGLAFYGRGGMNTSWQGGNASFDPDGPGPAPVGSFAGTYGAGAAGVDLAQAFVELAYARRKNDRFAWGLATVLAVQRFEASGVASFAPFTRSFAASGGTALPENLSDRGHDLSWGAGLRAGINALITPTVRVGLSYQSRVYMTEFDNYADLFAESGDFDIPASAGVALSWSPDNAFSLHLDVEHTWYSDVAAVGNPISAIFNCPTAGAGGSDIESCLGGRRGAGFGWRDVTTIKLGGEWRASDALTLRAGVSHGRQPIPETEVVFNILAPGVIEEHFTAGFSRRIGRGAISGAVLYAPKERVAGINSFDPTQRVEFEMHQFELELSYGWQF